jgi:hypothetical protein
MYEFENYLLMKNNLVNAIIGSVDFHNYVILR